MITCTSCGAEVTGKKFCPQCGTPVQSVSVASTPSTSPNVCPRCNGEVTPGAAFCMHCGTALQAQPAAPTLQAATPAFCTHCGKQAVLGARFCQGCGSPLGDAAPVTQQSGQYPLYQQQYGPQQYPQYQQQYPQPYGQQYPQQYAQGGYQQQIVLRCPTCQAIAPVGTSSCSRCNTSLANIVPTPANMPMQGQQGGLGGLMQGNNGKMIMGALGGAAAVLGGEMLLHGIENSIENRVEDDMGYGGYEHHRHHHHRDEGLLGGLGDVANDLGLF
jgi:predicted amidophosphoribosyltransferase